MSQLSSKQVQPLREEVMVLLQGEGSKFVSGEVLHPYGVAG